VAHTGRIGPAGRGPVGRAGRICPPE